LIYFIDILFNDFDIKIFLKILILMLL